ncbi:hypothetical protein B9Z65_7330 [Elsinoe australis]|uniref:Uncharacterized protein n=1 Tax=Elsinoe australis TaxID=40998 RepID=A0A2P7YBV6_9PEZI|nr:hypothetical protein B9Z65_7330 [Elsinoe australis]
MQELFLDSRQPLMIVIDALDEFQTDAQVEILSTLRSAMNQRSTVKPPKDWLSDAEDDDLDHTTKVTVIHGTVAGYCVKYLLFKEIGEIELMPKGQLDVNEALFEMSMLSMLDEDDSDSNQKSYHGDSSDKNAWFAHVNPSERGLGQLFNYAACYWPQHLGKSNEDPTLNPQVFLGLASPGSTRLISWSQQYRWPSYSFGAERNLPDGSYLDSLAIAVFFHWNEMASVLLHHLDLDPDRFSRGSIERATEWTLRDGQYSLVQDFLLRVTRTRTAQNIFRRALTQWYNINGESGRAWESLRDHESNKWSSSFINIINVKHTLLMESGPWILTEAARLGCLRMIKVLLESDGVPKDLRQAILSDGGRDWNGHHLFVAEAAYWDHSDVVDYLCQQGVIDVHLRHLGPNGDTVYHAAARTGRTEIFQVLYSCWPEAIDQANDHDRPLARLMFNRPRGIDPIEAVNFLLYPGGADSRPPEEARQRNHNAAQPEHETTSEHASALEILDAWALSNSAQTHKLDIICSVSKDSSDILEDSFP